MSSSNIEDHTPHVVNHFGFSCSGGSTFYVCLNSWGEFIGCCTVDPCANGDGICPEKFLQAATFNPSTYKELPPQSCSHLAGSEKYYACESTYPPFFGCCDGDPRVNGTCAQESLVPTKLTWNQRSREEFVKAWLATTATMESTPTTTSIPTTWRQGDSHNRDVKKLISPAAVAGISLAAMLIALIILGVFIWNKWSLISWH